MKVRAVIDMEVALPPINKNFQGWLEIVIIEAEKYLNTTEIIEATINDI